MIDTELSNQKRATKKTKHTNESRKKNNNKTKNQKKKTPKLNS